MKTHYRFIYAVVILLTGFAFTGCFNFDDEDDDDIYHNAKWYIVNNSDEDVVMRCYFNDQDWFATTIKSGEENALKLNEISDYDIKSHISFSDGFNYVGLSVYSMNDELMAQWFGGSNTPYAPLGEQYWEYTYSEGDYFCHHEWRFLLF